MRLKSVLSVTCLIVLGWLSVHSFGGAPPQAHARASSTPSYPENLEKFVLQVGIDKYQYEAKLEGCVQDVLDMKELLTSPKYAVPAGNILTLLNEQATHEGIVAAFKKQLIENARKHPNAIVIFQYSGHGSQVLDTNNDEEDGLDETLVPVNSRDPQNKNFDLTDDELGDLFEELIKHTPNVTFILDSCHSGSGMRGFGKVRKADRDKRPQPAQKPSPRARGERDAENVDVLPRSQRYVTISGSRSNELSNEMVVLDGSRSNGAMTFYLIDALKRATPETTYREVMEEVSSKVGEEYPRQHPQVEGDVRRPVFAGAASRENPFIGIAGVKGTTLTIKAGLAQGMKKGTQLAVYAADARKMAGGEKRLATAEVKTVENFTATAELNGAQSVPVNAKVVVISPDFGSNPLRVAFQSQAAGRATAADSKMLADLRRRLAPEARPGEVRGIVVTDAAVESQATGNKELGWDVAVLRDKFGNVFRDRLGRAITDAKDLAPLADKSEKLIIPGPEEEVYYIAAPDNVPLYGFFVRPGDNYGAGKIESALVHFAYQRALKSISNQTTTLKNAIKLTPVRITATEDANGELEVTKEEVVTLAAGQKDYPFDQGELFKIEIENTSDKDLYVTLFDISTDGSIAIMYPSEEEGVKLPAGDKVRFKAVYRTTGPPGYETFKAIATTEVKGRSDFAYLEITAVKRAKQETVKSFGDWTTSEINFEISDKKK
ncbi:MAG TPA: caspase family protein [Pyrinomonadaceae bacterium]|nr:caspase family protein [Pyrinomonadaceae bacterium]